MEEEFVQEGREFDQIINELQKRTEYIQKGYEDYQKSFTN